MNTSDPEGFDRSGDGQGFGLEGLGVRDVSACDFVARGPIWTPCPKPHGPPGRPIWMLWY